MTSSAPILTVELESSALDALGVPASKLAVFEYSGRDTLSRLFEVKLSVVYRNAGAEPLDLSDLIDAEVAVVFRKDGVETRRIHGVIRSARDHMTHSDESDYEIYDWVIAPRISHLEYVENFEVYLDKTVPEIIESKLDAFGFAAGKDYEFRLLGSYPVREFVLQYRESDLAFVKRLAEHVGIAFHFDHSGGADKIVFSDHGAGFGSVAASPLPFNVTGKPTDVFRLRREARREPESALCIDYDYRHPAVELASTFQSTATPFGGIVDYAANFTSPEEGASIAKVRVEARQCDCDIYRGKADIQSIFAGGRFRLEGHSRSVPELLVTSVTFRGSQPAAGAQSDAKSPEFVLQFRAIPASREFRPARTTPRPKIHGVLPAVIETDDAGTVASTPVIDSLGRYRIRFKFDVESISIRHGSHWVRLAQPLAGPSYGWSFPIRRGVEVMVAFEDGDPDRPVIVGAVYDGHAPNHVTSTNSMKSRLVSESGVLFEIDDGAGS